MKLRGVEGTPQEIRDLFVNEGLQLADYLEKPHGPLQKRWLVIPAVLFGVALLLLVMQPSPSKTTLTLLFLLGSGAIVWLAIAIQVRFESAWATGVAAVGGLLMILVAAGFISPKETIDALKELKGK